ncbi:endonuclease/exonuclease/phosphatase family protein [Flavobacterium adhaerens]|uniref:endonuclease/exonuclease/phosphatase family protein n=1 Tax=Flavobacterium adhaerens TaxID=3149043 RepID=UPI0032B434F7
MKFIKAGIYLLLLFFILKGNAQSKSFVIHTLAFYNFENCYDTINDPTINDEDWTPRGNQHWNSKKYHQKLENLARVLSEIGSGENSNAPTFIGGAEIENRTVLEDLIQQPKLIDKDYGIIHFDSPDKRGIDVALLYQKKQFQPTSFSNIPLHIYREKSAIDGELKTDGSENLEIEDVVQFNLKNNRVYTRDQLLVSGFLNGEEIHLIVNHWPSRAGGAKKSSPFREAAGALNRKIMDSLQRINPNAKIITMGDLNDSPFNKSVKKVLGTKGKIADVPQLGIYNPFEELANKGMGTIAFRDAWDIFDQILVSQTLLQKDYSSFQFWKAGIYKKPFLIQKSGRYKGYPLRHSQTEIGFSDHFPVYIYLIKEKK